MPPDYHFRVHLRGIVHTSPLNYTDGFNILTADHVWNAARILVYDSALVGNEYGGEADSCGIQPIAQPSATISPPTWTLVQDSGWFVTQKFPGDPATYVHPDGQRLFDAFYSIASDTVPVFIIPHLIELQADGSYGWRGIEALAFASGTMFPSIWINARVNHADGIFSTLAHEMSHILIDPQPPSLWGDNSTPFLHIQTHILPSVQKLTRASTAIGRTILVNATDQNRQNLIRLRVRDACLDAKFSRYVKLERP